MCKSVLQGTLDGGPGQGRLKKSWMDNDKNGHPFPWMNTSQHHTTDLTGGGFMDRRH
ncbi:hypothetical protein DPMN_058672 [Dreissena polymorpha]|uniref:Uncharacterized protein n=1 Tax=Dreissena polymorpha TaxID=45954 RepID=A0A9D4HGD4_DREPO|nr:hypothetical protein DPMN_058672 [Dreissena polymorpha]